MAILLPVATVAFRFTAEGYFRVRENGALDSGYVDKEFEAITITVTAATLGITFGISLLLNILTIYKYKTTHSSAIASEEISLKLISKLFSKKWCQFSQCLTPKAEWVHLSRLRQKN